MRQIPPYLPPPPWSTQLPVEAEGSWVKYVDPDSGYAYFYNEVTYESTYDRPAGMVDESGSFASVRREEARNGPRRIPRR